MTECDKTERDAHFVAAVAVTFLAILQLVGLIGILIESWRLKKERYFQQILSRDYELL